MREESASVFVSGEKVAGDFIGEVERILAQHAPSERVQARQETDQQVAANEARIEQLSKYEEVIQKWLARYGVEAVVRGNEAGHLEVAVPELPETVPELPADYGYKGGAARAILEHSLGLPYSNPRDLDIMFVGEDENKEVSGWLMNAYMPEDSAHDNGIEPLKNDYFLTRDFTLNEVLYDGNKIICTRQCLTDMLRNIVRFTEYEKNESYFGEEFFIDSKLLAKAVRLVAHARAQGRERASITDEIDSLQELYVNDFHLALHLDRAMEQGREVAEEYVQIMKEKRLISSSIESVEDCFEYLQGRTDFVFRCAPESELTGEPEFVSELADEYLDDTPLSPVPLWKQKRSKHAQRFNGQ